MTDRAQRAEEARRKILETGDPELIRRLYLLEAAAPPQGQPPAAAPGGTGGPGLLGLGVAVAGGAWLGTVLGGLTLSPAMQAAFADVAQDLGVDMDGIDMASLEEAGAADPGEAGDGFGDLGDFFDL